MRCVKHYAVLKSLVLALALLAMSAPGAFAANVSSFSDTLSSISTSEASNHTLSFVISTGVDAGDTITITFPTGFALGSLDHTDVDLADDGTDIDLGATASGSTWGVGVSGQVVTITSDTGTIASGSTVTIEIGTNATHQSTGDVRVTNTGTSGSHNLVLGGTFGGSSGVGLAIIDDNQVIISAVVRASESASAESVSSSTTTTGGGGGLATITASSTDSGSSDDSDDSSEDSTDTVSDDSSETGTVSETDDTTTEDTSEATTETTTESTQESSETTSQQTVATNTTTTSTSGGESTGVSGSSGSSGGGGGGGGLSGSGGGIKETDEGFVFEADPNWEPEEEDDEPGFIRSLLGEKEEEVVVFDLEFELTVTQEYETVNINLEKDKWTIVASGGGLAASSANIALLGFARLRFFIFKP